MEDREIILLYWQRSERAIKETEKKYGGMLGRIAMAVLGSREDTDEALNDTYLRVWNAIPEDFPACFPGYLAKIVRNVAVDAFKKRTAVKRGGREYAVPLEELEECVSGGEDPADVVQREDVRNVIERCLRDVDETQRNVFLRRYFYFSSISEIADDFSLTEANVKTILFRLRAKLKEALIKEDYQ